MTVLLVSLLIFLALWSGFSLGIRCTIHTIETRYPTTWEIMGLEIEANKWKRADAARDKEA